MPAEPAIPISVLLRAFRVPVQGVEVVTKDGSPAGCLANLSREGAFISTTKPAVVGARVQLAFTLPPSRGAIRIEGVVRWVVPPGRRRSGGYGAPGVGVEFVRVSRGGRKQIERYVRAFISRMRGVVNE